MRRMDRYKEEESSRESREEKYKELYQNTNKYTNITDVTNSNVYEINKQTENKNTRENYHQLKKYQNIEHTPKVKKDLEDFNKIYKTNEKKNYDINSVLEEARKNKKDQDDLEEKRKLKHTSYNVLAGVNLEELIKYREEKKNREETEEEKEIRDFVDTIASKTINGEIDKEVTVDLLSDLMATNMMDKVDKADNLTEKDIITETSQISIKEQIEIASQEDTKTNELPEKMKNADKDFYTRSMDLSDKDFDMDDSFEDKKLPIPVKIFIALLIIGILLATGYFIYKKMM